MSSWSFDGYLDDLQALRSGRMSGAEFMRRQAGAAVGILGHELTPSFIPSLQTYLTDSGRMGKFLAAVRRRASRRDGEYWQVDWEAVGRDVFDLSPRFARGRMVAR